MLKEKCLLRIEINFQRIRSKVKAKTVFIY